MGKLLQEATMLVMDLLAAAFFVALIWLLVNGPSHPSRA